MIIAVYASVLNDYNGTQNATDTYLIGTTTVAFVVTDNAGHTAGCTFAVIVADDEAPDINCPASPAAFSADSNCEAVLPSFVGGAILDDNCSDDADIVVVQMPASGSILGLGTSEVTLVATDEWGNSAMCSLAVVVVDDQAPSISCPASVAPLAADANCEGLVPDLVALSAYEDNCSPAVGIVLVQSPAAGSVIGLGVTTVTLTATDESGNATSCSVDVVVEDTLDPFISCPADIATSTDSGVCSAFVSVGLPTTSDNCGIASVLNDYNGTQNATDTYLIGTTTVAFVVTDNAGHTAGCTFAVIVADDEAPDINCPASPAAFSADSNCEAVLPSLVGGAILDDNCSDDADIVVVQMPASGSILGLGTSEVTLVATDEWGNSASCSLAVLVVDDEAPALSCPASVAPLVADANCEGLVPDLVALSAYEDNCSPAVAYSVGAKSCCG